MKCPECGADLTGADKFCSNCGAAVPSSDAVPSGTASPDETAASAPQTSESAQPEPKPLLAGDAQLEESEPTSEPLLQFEETPDFKTTAAAGAAPPVVKATSKRNTGLIIAIVVLVILLLCCCCAVGVVIARNFDQIISTLEAYQ